MSAVQRLVARTGLAANVPSLIVGELGWDYDTKTFRVGDNSATPPRIMTTKSSGSFDFSNTETITLNNIALKTNARIAGLDLGSMNSTVGILVRTNESGKFEQVSLTSGDESISVVNGNGVGGNLDIRLAQDLQDAIDAISGVDSVYQPNAPTVAKVGDLWMDSDNDVLYIYTETGSGPDWLDISTIGSGGISHTSAGSAPPTPAVGDEWYSTTEETLYKFVNAGGIQQWMQIA